ncbi:hypothetical protein M3P05_05860 [Sansalvadorimonas sp. 2012CJ34-2]|uniref:Uncharacterized protein n=1 Tax=Parendozoicomonas callyspongiae TaxID=2942213 RepID=A0ABT0PDJ9_9GAMM|nr:hypothetical protein [Sansalvadorimonas sp. 2012CJ34-2]MCL6269464.1 hypothetical protein [Sansalvadorimonas sp. 2012CJ34-2]
MDRSSPLLSPPPPLKIPLPAEETSTGTPIVLADPKPQISATPMLCSPPQPLDQKNIDSMKVTDAKSLPAKRPDTGSSWGQLLHNIDQLRAGEIDDKAFVDRLRLIRKGLSYLDDLIKDFLLTESQSVKVSYFEHLQGFYSRILPRLFMENIGCGESLMSTAPLAKDAPVNFIWVGSLIPDHYLDVPVKMAQTNPDREVILWYYSLYLSDSEQQKMASLNCRLNSNLEKAIPHRIKVLDINHLDQPLSIEGDEINLKQLLDQVLLSGEERKKSVLVAADLIRFYLMAAGSEVIDEICKNQNLDIKNRTSTGMIYMDLDIPGNCMFQRMECYSGDVYDMVLWEDSKENPCELSSYIVRTDSERVREKLHMSSAPISDWLTQKLPAGLAALRIDSTVDINLLAVNQKQNPVFLRSLKQSKELIDDHSCYKCLVKIWIFSPVGHCFFDSITDAFEPLITFPEAGRRSTVMDTVAAFQLLSLKNETTVTRGFHSKVNVNLSSHWADQD